MPKSKTIVLINGNFVNDISWTEWKLHLEQKGNSVYAPANPGYEGNPVALRAQVHSDPIKTGFIDVVNNNAELINTIPEKLVIIGHSRAGMATFKLGEMGKAAAGVTIDGALPKNVFPPFQTLKTVIPAFGFFSSKKYFTVSRKWYDYTFFNTLPEKEKSFHKYAVPDSHKFSRQLVLNSFSNINFKKPHAPILFVGIGSDNIFPPNYKITIASRYKDVNSRVDVKIFEGKSHFICGEPDWEKVADYILDW